MAHPRRQAGRWRTGVAVKSVRGGDFLALDFRGTSWHPGVAVADGLIAVHAQRSQSRLIMQLNFTRNCAKETADPVLEWLLRRHPGDVLHPLSELGVRDPALPFGL